MVYIEKDFANCVFNPITKGRIIKNYPKINEILDTEDKIQPHIDRLLKYIIALYDSGSPLVYQEKELKFRKQAAAEVAGFHEEVDADVLALMYSCKDERLVKITLLYLKTFIKNRLWAMIVSTEAAFWTATEKLLSQNNESKTDALDQIKIQNETDDRLEKLENRFFGEDEDLKKITKGTGYRPEDMATKV